MNDFENIKQSTDITSFITSQAGGEVKKTGGSISLNPCPFCNHKDCFKIFPGTKSYKCFSCGQSGDMFRFVADYFKIADRYQVLLKASELTGIALTNSHEVKERSAADSAREIIFNRAAEIYNVELLAQPKALDILKETRDYSPKDVKKYRIGFSGMTRNLLYKALKDSFDREAMLSSGLFVEHDGKLFDFFAPKMFVFPHIMGKQVHDFSAKDALKHKKKTAIIPPYRLKAEYRLPNAFFYNQDALYYDPVYIVEGQHDAIQLMRRLDRANVLAMTGNPPGKAIEHLQKHIRGKSVYLAFDQDAGG
ncbi:MAG TPA: hypothetical protein ENJ15_01520, partial [Caldithrix abyssi]|nr:hypothetical protein [Caldithrix abyssi]